MLCQHDYKIWIPVNRALKVKQEQVNSHPADPLCCWMDVQPIRCWSSPIIQICHHKRGELGGKRGRYIKTFGKLDEQCGPVWSFVDLCGAALRCCSTEFPQSFRSATTREREMGESVEDEPWWPICSFWCPSCPAPLFTTTTSCTLHQYNMCYLVALNATFCCPLTPYWGHRRLSGVGISEPRDAAS